MTHQLSLLAAISDLLEHAATAIKDQSVNPDPAAAVSDGGETP